MMMNSKLFFHIIRGSKTDLEEDKQTEDMMKKQNYEFKEHTAKVIFKKSKNTVNTYSKTCSGASSFFTKSLIMQLKQNLPKYEYHEEKGTMKRDLSVETDICILRRYYRRKRDASQKSKYSINRTEIDTINEYNRDTSACGDSQQNLIANTHFNINLTSFVVDNLRSLLNDWIKTYLLENNETKEKIESVLDSILHQLDIQRNNSTPSSQTYTIDIQIVERNENQSTTLTDKSQKALKFTGRRNKSKNSTLSIPVREKHLRLISTLSLPRNIHKIKTSKDSLNITKNCRHKRALLSTSRHHNHILNSSNLKFLTMTTKSLTKRCGTYEQGKRSRKLKHYCQVENMNNQMVSSVYKNIYNLNNTSNINSASDGDLTKRLLRKENSTSMSAEGNSDPLISIDLIKNSTDFSEETKDLPCKLKTNKKATCRKCSAFKKRASKIKNYRNMKTKQYTYLFRKSNNNKQQEKELLKHFQSIFKYFSNNDGKTNLKLDIKVNVSPTNEYKMSKSLLSVTKQTTKPGVILLLNDNNLLVEDANQDSSNTEKNIISLLDAAASHTNYIINKGNSQNVTKSNNKKENIVFPKISPKNTRIAREINELKGIVKCLASITEKLVSDHIDKKKTLDVLDQKYNKEVDENNLNKNDVKKISKCIQYSNNIPKSQIISGLKLKKEPKKKNTQEYNPRLMKRSTSYNYIESESILKVTDMTSAAEAKTGKTINKDLTLPKSKSLLEVSVIPENKFLTFYCNDHIRPHPCKANDDNISYISIPCNNTCHHKKASPILYLKCDNDDDDDDNDCCDIKQPKCSAEHLVTDSDECHICDNDNSCSSVCIDIDKPCDKKLVIRNSNGLGCCEGFLYCVILWIPVLFIAWFFYINVIKDTPYTPIHNSNTSDIPIDLNDLGF